MRDHIAAECFERQLTAAQSERERLEEKARSGCSSMQELWTLHGRYGFTISGQPIADDTERINRTMNAIYEILDDAKR